jgi:hypothetical protein
VVDRVLSGFDASEVQTMTEALDRVADAVEAIIGVGPGAAMNRFNVRERSGGLSAISDEAKGEPPRTDVGNGE